MKLKEAYYLVDRSLPPMSRVGRPKADDGMVLNGILYVLTNGCRWCDMPVEYGSYKTAWRRLRRWVYGTVYLRPWPL